jgi:hypothetical protein
MRFCSAGVLIAATLATTTSWAGGTQAEGCTTAEQQRLSGELPHLTRWASIYASFKAYTPRCDDGGMAEGYTDAIVKVLANDWEGIVELEGFVHPDPAFLAFVIRHVDGSANLADLRKVLFNASQLCPHDLRRLCDSLVRATRGALRETRG